MRSLSASVRFDTRVTSGGGFSLSGSNAVPRSRERERVAEGRVRDVAEYQSSAEWAWVRCRAAFSGCFGQDARENLNDGNYATEGEFQSTLPDVLKVPPISQHGTEVEFIRHFGGAGQLRNAVNQLQALLYAA